MCRSVSGTDERGTTVDQAALFPRTSRRQQSWSPPPCPWRQMRSGRTALPPTAPLLVGLLLFNLHGGLVIMLTGPPRLFLPTQNFPALTSSWIRPDPTEVRKRKCKGEKIHRFLELWIAIVHGPHGNKFLFLIPLNFVFAVLILIPVWRNFALFSNLWQKSTFYLYLRNFTKCYINRKFSCHGLTFFLLLSIRVSKIMKLCGSRAACYLLRYSFSSISNLASLQT